MTPDSTNRPAIAIIGMGCIFPKSRNLKEYWRLLFNGIDAITPIPEDSHWKLKDYYDADPACPDHTYCTRGGFLPDIAFDPLSYGIPPNNIDATDTSQLLGLEVARMALADAGYPQGHAVLKDSKVNVVLGVTGTQELVIPLGARLGHPFWKQAMEDEGLDPEVKENILKRIGSAYSAWQENSFPGLLGNVVAGRIANRLDLSGTNCVSDAACASSLSAVHTAIMELQSGRCDMSVTGGVDTLNDIFMHMCFSKTGVLSHSSDARPFSKDADGTVLGEGIGMLVLKRLEDAQRDKDRIYAVIRGMGTSSDGRTSAIYAPEAKGQIRALNEAYAQAGIDPSTVEFIEAHGTGTRVGDKVEFTALRQCFETRSKPQSTAVGSVKSMIGHTKAAAGAAGMIKAALALYNKVIPPTLKAGEPDPELDIQTSPFYLNDKVRPWITGADNPRRSGVSAFGFGGSNFHVVLEEYRENPAHVAWDGSVQIFAFSGKDRDALGGQIRETARHLKEVNPQDKAAVSRAIAWQAQETRKNFHPDHHFRLLILYSGEERIETLLEQAKEALAGNTEIKAPLFMGEGPASGKLGFVFPGQGSQYPGMARELMSIFPEGGKALKQAQVHHEKKAGAKVSLTSAVYPLPGYAEDNKEVEARLRQTQTAQPAIGAVSMALNNILNRFKVQPAMTCGHSFGELCALYSAGWIKATDFLELSAARGHFMAEAGGQSKDAGSMMAVQAPLDKIRQLIADAGLDLVLANENSPSQGVLSGPTPQIEKALAICKEKKMRAVRLPVSAAFHSALVEKAAKPFSDQTRLTPVSPSKIPVLSNTTGQPYPLSPEETKALLGSQLMHPVRFQDNVQAMFDSGVTTFIEVGPKSVLTGLVKSILKGKEISALAIDPSGARSSGLYNLAAVLCTLGAQGHPLDLTQWEDPVDEPVKTRMAVMINGANPRPRPEPVPAVKKNSKAKFPARKVTEKTGREKPIIEQGSEMTPYPDTPLPRVADVKTDTAPAFQASPLPDAGMVQKGLEAMQQLQAQTARAHEKFLETQAEASRTLAALMAQTRGETIPVQTAQPEFQAPAPQPTVRPAVPPMPQPRPEAPPAARPTADTPHTQQSLQPDTGDTAQPVRETAAAKAQAAEASPGVQTVLFAIVSRLTGFPQEMLEPEMDIESDLGIDSIKKVEIISELEKEMPDGAGLSSDHLTTVRTLEDICNALGETAGAQDQTNQPEPAESRPAGTGAPETGPALPGRTMETLVAIISELTGFPKEMLEPSMNLESDLGIDSIKRVEILSRLEQELPDITAISPDEMGSLRTLEDIASSLEPESRPPDTTGGKKKTPQSARDDQLAGETLAPEAPLLRQEIVLKSYPTNQIRFYNGARIEVSPDRTIYLTADSSGIAGALQSEFQKQGLTAELVDLSRDQTPHLPNAAGIVIVPDAFEPEDRAKDFLAKAFDLASKNGQVLMDAAAETGAFFATLTFSGGTFGFKGHSDKVSHVYGGLAGLSKTADIEWKNVLCHALDLPADPGEAKANAEAAAALIMTHGAVEMGLDGEFSTIPEPEKRPLPEGLPDLGARDVVVISGGAKGVTAECALALARACSPKIALLGRSPKPFEEPEWLIPLESAPEIKQGILTHEFKGKKAKPADIEKRYQAIASNRSIKQTMEKIREYADDLAYYPVDIRDKEEVNQVFQTIRSRMGQVSALIHGAGVLKDKLIVEKTRDQFRQVFDTKVTGLENIMAAATQDALSHVVLFSSVAARFGNQGQCDYAMANEVLNKFAQAKARINPGCRYVAVNWGPWDGGMVNDGLKREFSKRGIDLIPLKQGAEQMIREMANPDAGCIEVVIGAGLKDTPSPKKKKLSPAMTCRLGPKASPVVNHHRIDRQPVVPLAMMADLMAHAGTINNPGLRFCGLDQVHLLKGILPKESDIRVQVELGKCIPENGGFLVPARLVSDDGKTAHAGATVRLADALQAPPVLSKAAFMDLKPSSLSVEEAYRKVLFHGPDLQCITDIRGVSEKGIEVIARCRPEPGLWYDPPHAGDWTMDPLMLDAAFQAAILWAFETRDAVCLPNFMDTLRVYGAYPGFQGDVRILFTVNHNGRHKIQGYFTFLDETGTVIASIMGFEAITDKGLKDKFKPQPLFGRDKILAFAQGNPSDAFGKPYAVFDHDREIARLPRPPYFFMDRVMTADHTPWEMSPGGWIETEYDIPSDEWYFRANRSPAMPFSILLEIALQPCGWLAAYAGSALQSDDRLHFRNLGGKATLIQNIGRDDGTLVVRSRMTEVSKAGGMIIQDFDMEVLNNGEMVFQGTTNFGFFTRQALANQIGIRKSRFHIPVSGKTQDPVVFHPDAPVTPDDETGSRNTGMPAAALRMIDTIDHLDFEGGLFGKGMIRGIKKVDPKEWFFDAHFYQDPVCPGSLGVESFLQLLRFYMIEKFKIAPEDYEIRMAENSAHEWVYRGQIIPANKTIEVQAHISDSNMDDLGCRVTASGSLIVDETCIYEMKDFSIEFVPLPQPGKIQQRQTENTKAVK